jgi:hypothetical protein
MPSPADQEKPAACGSRGTTLFRDGTGGGRLPLIAADGIVDVIARALIAPNRKIDDLQRKVVLLELQILELRQALERSS